MNTVAGTTWYDDAPRAVTPIDEYDPSPVPELIPRGALAALRGVSVSTCSCE